MDDSQEVEAKATKACGIAIVPGIKVVTMVTVRIGGWEAVVCGTAIGAMVIAVVIVLVVVLVVNDHEPTTVLDALQELEETTGMASKPHENKGTAASNLAFDSWNWTAQVTQPMGPPPPTTWQSHHRPQLYSGS